MDTFRNLNTLKKLKPLNCSLLKIFLKQLMKLNLPKNGRVLFGKELFLSLCFKFAKKKENSKKESLKYGIVFFRSKKYIAKDKKM